MKVIEQNLVKLLQLPQLAHNINVCYPSFSNVINVWHHTYVRKHAIKMQAWQLYQTAGSMLQCNIHCRRHGGCTIHCRPHEECNIYCRLHEGWQDATFTAGPMRDATFTAGLMGMQHLLQAPWGMQHSLQAPSECNIYCRPHGDATFTAYPIPGCNIHCRPHEGWQDATFTAYPMPRCNIHCIPHARM